MTLGNSSSDPAPAGVAAPGAAGGPPSVWTDIRAAPLSVDECLAAVSGPAVGGVTFFVGTVRDVDGGRGVTELEYTAHPRAAAELERVARAVAEETGVRAVAAVHRIGLLGIGETAVVVAAGAGHRGEAFGACRRLIDDVKAQVPIWKRQVFTDGMTEWVGAG